MINLNFKIHALAIVPLDFAKFAQYREMFSKAEHAIYYTNTFIKSSIISNLDIYASDYYEIMFTLSHQSEHLKLKDKSEVLELLGHHYDLNLLSSSYDFLMKVLSSIQQDEESIYKIEKKKLLPFLAIVSEPECFSNASIVHYREIFTKIDKDLPLSPQELNSVQDMQTLEYILFYAFQEKYSHLQCLFNNQLIDKLYHSNAQLIVTNILYENNIFVIDKLLEIEKLTREQLNSQMATIKTTTAYPTVMRTFSYLEKKFLESQVQELPRLHNDSIAQKVKI